MVRLERLVSTLLVNNMSSALSGTKWLISRLEQFPIQLLTCVQTLITVPMSSATEDFFFLSLPYHTKQGNSIIGLSILDNEGCQCRSWLPRFNYSGPKLLLSSSCCTLVPVLSFCSQMGRSGRLGSRWSNVDVVHLKVCPLAAITGVEYGLDIILGQEKLFFGSNWWNLSAPENSWGGQKLPLIKLGLNIISSDN